MRAAMARSSAFSTFCRLCSGVRRSIEYIIMLRGFIWRYASMRAAIFFVGTVIDGLTVVAAAGNHGLDDSAATELRQLLYYLGQTIG